MPYAKTQSVLKKLLPKQCFMFLYRLGLGGYVTWHKMLDKTYYPLAHIYYLLIGDKRNVRKIRTICLIKSYSMVGRSGLSATYDIADKIEKNNIDGCFVECGVARGGCSALMALVANENKSNRKVWLFDSFEGLPEHTIEDEYKEPIIDKPKDKHDSLVSPGYCLGTYDEVEKLLFSKLSLNKNNVFMVKGWFQDTLPNYKDKIGAIAILRIDADWYESTKCCLENLYDNVITGGYIIIDDYGTHIGCKKATDELLRNKDLNVKLIFDYRGGCYFVKP
jgi:O-methyltransferase